MSARQYFTASHGMSAILILWITWTQPSIALNTLPVALFVDAYCDDASPLNPNVNVPINMCIVTPGAFGFKVPTFTCSDGTQVKFLTYTGSACGSTGWNSDGDSCQNNYPDPMVGFVIYCGAEEQLQIASTTTITVGTNVLSATAAAASTLTSGGSPTSTQLSGSTDSSSSLAAAGTSPHGWAGLSNGERIGAIIALAIGIPSVFLALITLWVMCIR